MDEKVTEMKIELNKFLNEANNILLSCEKIYKGTENSNIINDNYEIKTLFYISEIHKNNERAKIFFKKPIRNLNLNIGTFSNNPFLFGPNIYNYTYYYFSGITVPKNITVRKNNNKLSISWSVDELRIKDSMKFCLQIKINGEESIYESNFMSLELDKYDENADYEIKVRLCVNDSFGDWSEPKKFKINELDNGNPFNPFNKIENNINNNKNNLWKEKLNIVGGLFEKCNSSLFNNDKNKEEDEIIKKSENLFNSKQIFDNNIIKEDIIIDKKNEGLFENNIFKSLFSNDKNNEENKVDKNLGLFGQNNLNLKPLFSNDKSEKENILNDKLKEKENKA